MRDDVDPAGKGVGNALRVEVPCSTSNLGPGFDLLGLCLDLFLSVAATATVRPGPLAVEVVRAPDGWPSGDTDLVVRALRRALGARADLAVALEIRSQIPIARGLGSSGAAVAAGLLLGDALAQRHGAVGHSGTRLCASELLAAAVELEGHPDNALAALHGGCVLSIQAARGWRVIRQPLHPAIGFAAAWPKAPLHTPLARSVLPKEVAFADAVDQPRRLAALLEGLRTGDPELIAHGTVEHLHVRHRAPLIAGADAALAAARAAGAWSATISGSGSTLIAMGAKADAPRLARVLADALEHHQPVEGFRALEPVLAAPTVI
jgi:homoserine kinase